MSYNPSAGIRNPQGPARKPKRVVDVNAMGPAAPINPYMQPTQEPTMFDPMMNANTNTNFTGYNVNPPMSNLAHSDMSYNSGFNTMPNQNYGYMAPSTSQPQPPMGINTQFGAGVGIGAGTGIPNNNAQFVNTQFAMFQQPIVQDMAMQYGQRLADQGKQLVENQFEKWVPVSKLRYYFAVDTSYVIRKLRLILFPFAHKDWSLKYDQENPVQPRYDINAPDLYIPTMAYITYVVLAGLLLGMQSRFSPEQLGIQASSALAYSIFELVVYSITLYVVNIKTNLKTLDLMAFAGYKFIGIVSCLLISTMFHRTGYYIALLYCSCALGFFLLRTLKTKVLHDPTPTTANSPINYDPYGNPQQLDYTGGRKRKLYFLFLIVVGQMLLLFLLSNHLYLTETANLSSKL